MWPGGSFHLLRWSLITPGGNDFKENIPALNIWTRVKSSNQINNNNNNNNTDNNNISNHVNDKNDNLWW